MSCVNSHTMTVIKANYYLILHKYNFNTRYYNSKTTAKTPQIRIAPYLPKCKMNLV